MVARSILDLLPNYDYLTGIKHELPNIRIVFLRTYFSNKSKPCIDSVLFVAVKALQK